MKVIFLDFDGVINNWKHFDGVDYENVKFLLDIINETNALVVATSSTKYSFQRNLEKDYKDTNYFRYVSILNNLGVNIFDVTPYVNGDRELEILEYLNIHKEIEQFLILDDDYVFSSLLEHQVFLDLYNGICNEHVKPSVDILNGKLGFYPDSFNFNETVMERVLRINKYHMKNK